MVGILTFFIEMSGTQAQAVLSDLAGRLRKRPACRTLRLLESAEQEGLFLLVLEWQGEALPELPENAKAWKFKTLRTNEHEF